MNCHCNPPLNAVIKTVQQQGPNFGKEFFSCPLSKCNHFSWVGSKNIPVSLHLNNLQKNNRTTNSKGFNSKSNGNRKDTASDATVKIGLNEFDSANKFVMVVWCSLIMCPHLPSVEKVLQALPKESCQYLERFKMWKFNICLYQNVVNKLKSSEFSNVIVEGLPNFIINGIQNYLKRCKEHSESVMELKLPQQLKTMLKPFQTEGVQFVINHGGRALIGDDMGTGKTVQAIAVMVHYQHLWPALVMLPVAIVHQWQKELLFFCQGILTASDIVTIRKATDPIGGHICLIPYSVLDTCVKADQIRPDQFKIVIADESHNLKTLDAQRTKAALPFLKTARVALCLTGTPAINRPVELFSQLNGLLPDMFHDYDQFIRRYCDAKPSRFGTGLDAKGSSNEVELKLILDNLVMIRRLKSDINKGLPEKLRQIIYVEPSDVYRRQLEAIKRQSDALDRKVTSSESERFQVENEKRTLLGAYYRVTGLSKLKGIQETLIHLVRDMKGLDRSEGIVQDLNTVDEVVHELNDGVKAIPRVVADAVVEEEDVIECYWQAPKKKPSEVIELISDEEGKSDEVHRGVGKDLLSSPVVVMHPLTDRVATLTPSNDKMVMAMMQDVDTLTATPSQPGRTSSHLKRLRKTRAVHDDLGSCSTLTHSEDMIIREGDCSQSQRSGPISHPPLPPLPPPLNVHPVRPGSSRVKATKENHQSRGEDKDDAEFLFEEVIDETGVWQDGHHPQMKQKEPVSRRGGFFLDEEDEEMDFHDESVHLKSKAAVGTETLQSIQDVLKSVESDTEEKIPDFGPRKKKRKEGGKKRMSKREQSALDSMRLKASYKGTSQKIIVFGHHGIFLDALEGFLREEGVNYVRVDGSTTSHQRDVLISRFQEDDETDVALLSISACGTGLNLTRASVALFGELYWAPGIVMQAEDRIHRMGQKADNVKIIYILAKNSADDIVWEQIQKKHDVLGATIGIAEKKVGGQRGLRINERKNEGEVRGERGREEQLTKYWTTGGGLGVGGGIEMVKDNVGNQMMEELPSHQRIGKTNQSDLAFVEGLDQNKMVNMKQSSMLQFVCPSEPLPNRSIPMKEPLLDQMDQHMDQLDWETIPIPGLDDSYEVEPRSTGGPTVLSVNRLMELNQSSSELIYNCPITQSQSQSQILDTFRSNQQPIVNIDHRVELMDNYQRKNIFQPEKKLKPFQPQQQQQRVRDTIQSVDIPREKDPTAAMNLFTRSNFINYVNENGLPFPPATANPLVMNGLPLLPATANPLVGKEKVNLTPAMLEKIEQNRLMAMKRRTELTNQNQIETNRTNVCETVAAIGANRGTVPYNNSNELHNKEKNAFNNGIIKTSAVIQPAYTFSTGTGNYISSNNLNPELMNKIFMDEL